MHIARLAKTHLDLGWMHVHIDPRRVERDEQQISRLALAVQHIRIGTARGVRDGFVAHEAAVHVNVLLVRSRARRLRQPGKTRDAQRRSVVGVARQHLARRQRQGLRQPVAAEHIGDAATDPRLSRRGRVGCVGFRCAPLFDEPAVVPDGEADIRAHQRVSAHRFQAVRELGGVGFQKLAARRCAEKQLAHLDRGAHVARDRANLSTARVKQVGAVRMPRARCKCEFGHRGRRGQRLAAKPQRCNRFELGQRGDLAGGMAQQRQRQLLARNAAAVVGHRQQPHAAGGQSHRDVARSGIQRIVEQLAQHGRRPLDHLAGRDLADQLLGQRPDRPGGQFGRSWRRCVH